jgi:hypothetical protein
MAAARDVQTEGGITTAGSAGFSSIPREFKIPDKRRGGGGTGLEPTEAWFHIIAILINDHKLTST